MPEYPVISTLESHLGYWMRQVSNHVSQAFAAKVAEHGVTVAEWVLLRQLWNYERVAPSRIADDLATTRGAISKLVDRLEAKALIARTQMEDDRRFQDIALTEAGRAVVPVLAAIADANDAEVFGCLTADEHAALAAVLKAIVQRRKLASVPTD